MDALNPLTPEDCDCLDRLLESTAKTRELLLKCKNCGFDIQRAMEENDRQEATATALKKNFFPGRP